MRAFLLLMATALTAACLGGIAIEPLRPQWPQNPDGTPMARCESPEQACCATEGAPGLWEIRECPTPTPTPSPTPSPAPSPEPDPDPTPEPTPDATPEPTPEPSTCGESLRSQYRITCKWDACDVQREPENSQEPAGFGEALRDSIKMVLAVSGDIVTGGNLIRTEHIEIFTRRVASELRQRGLCAKAGDPERSDTMGPDEVAIWDEACLDQDGNSLGACRAHFDLVVEPGDGFGRVGQQLRSFIVLGRRIDGSVPDPEPVAGLCEGFGQPPNWDWIKVRGDNFSTDHWVPLDSYNSQQPAFGHDVRSEGGRYVWSRDGRMSAPWYATNADIGGGFMVYPRVRHEDGLRCNAAGICQYDDHFRYYGPSCPTFGLIVGPDDPVRKTRP